MVTRNAPSWTVAIDNPLPRSASTLEEARDAMMDTNEKALCPMHTVDDNLMTVFKLTEGTATLYSFTDDPVVYAL